MFKRTLEMGLDRAELFRLLPRLVGEEALLGETVTWTEAGRRATLRATPMPHRRLGSVELPRMSVEIELEGGSGEEGEALLARFLRVFLRGGG